MRPFLAILCLFVTGAAFSQDTATASKDVEMLHPAYERHSFMITASAGFINGYKSEYSVPAGFEKGQVTGFAPIFGKVEYAASNKFGIAFITGFNTLYFNSFQLYKGYYGDIRRYRADRFNIFSGGLAGYYHFTGLRKVKRLDPFIGAGLNLNNIRHSALPQGDSVVATKEHSITPYLKVGARYYISDKVSAYADAGYDKLSLVTVGISCRFFYKPKAAATSK